jgi:hypothetical protein
MKTKLEIGLGVVLALSLLGCQLIEGPSEVDRIIAKHIEATGGRAAQEAINSMIQKGGAHIAAADIEADIAAAGVEADFVSYYKNGNRKNIMEIPGLGQLVQGVTGDIAWQMAFGANAILQGDAAAFMREDANPNPLLNWQETYESAEITGEENGATIVVFETHSGTRTTRYFDLTSGLLTKQVQPDPSGSSLTNTFTDYKKVGEVMQAHKVGVDVVQAQFEIIFTSMELNTQIDDSTFDIPDVIKALLPD